MTGIARTGATRPRIGDVLMSRLARLLVHVFFRRMDVEGAEHLPAHGPVVLVANHVNGLVDGLVLMAVLERHPRFLGKATLFRLLPLAPFLHLAGVVPVYRAKDSSRVRSARTERNEEAFRTSRALLVHGGLVALFPEGISHDEARLQPLRTGAARVALGAAIDDGADQLATVAVGLVYDDKARFRSQALVRIGPPVGVTRWASSYRRDPVATVRLMTDDLGRQLAAVAPMYASRRDELAFHRIAGMLASSAGATVDLAERDRKARALARLASTPTDGSDHALGELRATADRYEQELALLGLTDAQVAAGLSSRHRRRLGASFAVATLAAPVAAFGAVFHAVPYLFVKQVAKRTTNEGMKATIKLLGCFSLFVTGYALFSVLVGRRRGLLAGVAAFAAGPASGYVTVRFAERMHRIGGITRARSLLRQRQDLVPGLFAQRSAVMTRATAVLRRSPVEVGR